MDINFFSSELEEKNGIFFAKNKSEISYPESGNADCFQLEENSFWFKHRNNCILSAVLKICPSNVFFDIGGGNGFVAKELENKGVKTVLLEPGLEGCLNAKKRNLKNIICSTLEDAKLHTNSIPAIGVFDVVEHIKDDISFLKYIHEILKQDGYLFITVPAYTLLWSKEDTDAGHFRRYTRSELESKLKSLGFTIQYSSYIFSILVAAVFIFRALPYKLGLQKKSYTVEKHKKDHESKKGVLDNLLNLIWNWEKQRVEAQKTIPFGGSCFIVAKK